MRGHGSHPSLLKEPATEASRPGPSCAQALWDRQGHEMGRVPRFQSPRMSQGLNVEMAMTAALRLRENAAV